ncbi:MAG: Lrp/AsnC family transcriptional regulator [Candidatus Kariarchaeaceae archaeon]
MSLDEVDRKIIEILRRDGRIPFTEIGRELEISDATVHVRVKRMQKENIIKRFTVIVDEEVLGKKVSGFVLLNVMPGSLEKVVDNLLEIECVNTIYEIHGLNDLILKILAADLDEMRDFLMNIREIQNVTSSELMAIYKAWSTQDA